MSLKEEKKPVAKKDFTYREQHAIVVRVANEAEQQKAFERLQALGFKNLKLVSV